MASTRLDSSINRHSDERADVLALDGRRHPPRERTAGNVQNRTEAEGKTEELEKIRARTVFETMRTPSNPRIGGAKMTESKPTRVALYARVSTANTGQSPEMQLRELREHCERRGWTVAGEDVDAGISGTKDRRPELDRLMADAHKRRFDVIAVWKFDRFARSVTHLLRALDTFRVLGVEFVSLSESLDTATPAGRMVFTVLGAVAELERSLIAERVRAGLRNARSRAGD